MGEHQLSQSILLGYQWAKERGIDHNHSNLFTWGERYDEDGQLLPQIKLESACAIGFGWIGCLLLDGIADDQVLFQIYEVVDGGIPDYDTFISDTKQESLCPMNCDESFSSISAMVVHLNDQHHWAIERIVEHLMLVEPEESRLELARTVEIPTERAGPTVIQQVIEELGLTQAEVNLLS